MPYIHDPDTIPKDPKQTTLERADDMGALAPISSIKLKLKPPPKKELYRPADAGRLALRPNRQIIRHLMLQCVKEGITMTRWFERQALDYLKKCDPETKTMGAQAPQIDRLLDSEYLNPSSISAIFTFWVGAFNSSRNGFKVFKPAGWTNRDATAAQLFSDVRDEIIELAILRVIQNWLHSTRSIRSFNFFREEISALALDFADLDPANLVVRLHHERTKTAKVLRVTAPPLTPEQQKIVDQIADAPRRRSGRP